MTRSLRFVLSLFNLLDEDCRKNLLESLCQDKAGFCSTCTGRDIILLACHFPNFLDPGILCEISTSITSKPLFFFSVTFFFPYGTLQSTKRILCKYFLYFRSNSSGKCLLFKNQDSFLKSSLGNWNIFSGEHSTETFELLTEKKTMAFVSSSPFPTPYLHLFGLTAARRTIWELCIACIKTSKVFPLKKCRAFM